MMTIFSSLIQGFEGLVEREIPHPIHPAWAGQPWPSDVGEFGFEFFVLWVKTRIRGRDHSGVFEEGRNAYR